VSPPKLSICIPTYNRAPYLPTALESFATQITGRDDIEIVVSDNASTDETREVVRSFEQRLPHLRYFRCDENVNFDRNFLKVVELATGEYCWVFGDDDAVRPGAVQAVMDALAEGHDVYLTNAILYDEDWGFLEDRAALDLPGDCVFLLSDPVQRLQYCEHAAKLEAFFGFISTQIFRRELCYRSIASNQAAFARFIESHFIHAWLLLNATNSGPVSLRYMAAPLVNHRWLRQPFTGTDKRLLEPGVMGGIFIDAYMGIARTAFGEESVEEFHIRRVMRGDLRNRLRALLTMKTLMATPDARRGTARMEEFLLDGSGPRVRLIRIIYRLTPVIGCRLLYRGYRAGRGAYRRMRAVWPQARQAPGPAR
jgi:O-antigen biosynthesis alpha-1,3-abequosyltransferase